MTREDMLAKVEAAYHARRTGNFSALQVIVTENAEFTFAGEQSLQAALPGSGGVSVHLAAKQLFDTIEIRSLKPMKVVAEDNRIAILWHATLVPRGGEAFETDMFDLWEFGDDGRICKGTQFLDTAKLIDVMK